MSLVPWEAAYQPAPTAQIHSKTTAPNHGIDRATLIDHLKDYRAIRDASTRLNNLHEPNTAANNDTSRLEADGVQLSVSMRCNYGVSNNVDMHR